MTTDLPKLKRSIQVGRIAAVSGAIGAAILAYLTARQGPWWLVGVNIGLFGANIGLYVANSRTIAKVDTIIAMLDETKMIQALQRNECPDCGNGGMAEGPHGGASVNVACPSCGSRFNACGPGLGGGFDLRLTFAVQRI